MPGQPRHERELVLKPKKPRCENHLALWIREPLPAQPQPAANRRWKSPAEPNAGAILPVWASNPNMLEPVLQSGASSPRRTSPAEKDRRRPTEHSTRRALERLPNARWDVDGRAPAIPEEAPPSLPNPSCRAGGPEQL